ncbi:alpha/beta hydrolase [Sinirhodobacter populi]|nr:alpha/beta hydrolase [Sinirhodobacter populi]
MGAVVTEAPLRNDLARGPDGGRAFWVTTADGLRLRVGHWPGADKGADRGTVFLLPGRSEYVEKYGPAATEFAARGYGLIMIDWRGQGLSPRLHADPARGHLLRFGDFQRDLDALLAQGAALDLPRPWFVLSHSMGGAIALRRLTEAHPFRACAFSAPMWGVGVPRWLRPWAPQLARWLRGGRLSEAYVRGTTAETYVLHAPFEDNMLTTDARMWAWLVDQAGAEPRLALGGPSYQWAAESILECQALTALPSPALPCLTVIGSNERIINTRPVHERMARWPGGRLLVVEGGEHEVMMETPARRKQFYDAVAALFDAAR